MKKLSILLIALFLGFASFAQSSKYEQAMTKALTMLDTANAIKTFQKVSNQFERIAAAEPNEVWPNYYVAYSSVKIALRLMGSDIEQMMAMADKAQAALDLALALEPNNSELVAMQGYVLHVRVWGDPQANGPTYAPKAQAILEKAIALDANNPRAYHLIGQNLFFTPAFWGGGADNAKPFLEKAATQYASFQSDDVLAPTWGAEWNADLLKRATGTTENEKG